MLVCVFFLVTRRKKSRHGVFQELLTPDLEVGNICRIYLKDILRSEISAEYI